MQAVFLKEMYLKSIAWCSSGQNCRRKHVILCTCGIALSTTVYNSTSFCTTKKKTIIKWKLQMFSKLQFICAARTLLLVSYSCCLTWMQFVFLKIHLKRCCRTNFHSVHLKLNKWELSNTLCLKRKYK